MAASALLLLLACLWVARLALQAGGWWLVLLVPSVLVGAACAYGVGESLERRPRP